jgi:DNA modification methylase
VQPVRLIFPGIVERPAHADLYYGIDVIDGLRLLPDKSVQMIATSPPYWGLRDYGVEGRVWGGNASCEHTWGNPDRIDPVPPGKRQCRQCGRFSTTSWIDDSNTMAVCSNCGLETPHEGVTTKGSIGVKDTSNTEDWTVKRTRVPYTGSCSKCGAWKGCLGLEPTPEMFVQHLVEVFREARRVLRDDGVLWLNLGDSYASARAGHTHTAHTGVVPASRRGNDSYGTPATAKSKGVRGGPLDALHIGVKHKDLVGIPWMTAFALRADGWYLRSDIIWNKPNCMPEAVRDRPTKAHEYVFLLTKSPKYFYDQNSTRETCQTEDVGIPWREREYGGTGFPGELNGEGSYKRGTSRVPVGNHPAGKNKRTVWTVNPKPYKGAHFATWPEDLVEPMIKAGSSLGDTVLDPFSGSGTTGRVALLHGRNYIGLDLNSEYLGLAQARLLGLDAPTATEDAADNLIEDLFGG